jgi:hypothetical protein
MANPSSPSSPSTTGRRSIAIFCVYYLQTSYHPLNRISARVCVVTSRTSARRSSGGNAATGLRALSLPPQVQPQSLSLANVPPPSPPPTLSHTLSHTHSLPHTLSPTLSHTLSPTHPLPHPPTHPLPHTLSHTPSPTHPLPHTLSPCHPLTHILSHTHLLPPPQAPSPTYPTRSSISTRASTNSMRLSGVCSMRSTRTATARTR